MDDGDEKICPGCTYPMEKHDEDRGQNKSSTWTCFECGFSITESLILINHP